MEKDKNKKKDLLSKFKFKKFELNSNNMRGLMRTFRIFIAFVIIILLLKLVIGIFAKPKTDYPIVYKKSDGSLIVLGKKDKEGTELSKLDSPNDVLYPNKSDRYVLFKKNASLYVYDSKKKEVNKVTGDVKKYYFSSDDRYVVSTDEDNNLYAYNYKKNEKIVSDIDSVKLVTDKYVIYLKNDDKENDKFLFIRSLNYKKDEKLRIDRNFGKDISLIKGNKLIYIDGDRKLKIYDINSRKINNIDSDVNAYYSDSELDSFYYLTLDDTLYYYDGNKTNKITNDVYNIAALDIKNKQVVYSKKDKRYTLYYQKSSKEADVIEKDLKTNIDYVYMFEGKHIYYVNKDNDLMFARINGSKVGQSRSVITDVEVSTFHKTKAGYIFIADASKKGLGSLYLAKSYKAKKIDTEVVGTNIKVSSDGNKFYYLKNYGNYVGDLYVSSGGKPKNIDHEVYKYQFINDKMIYYIKDYNGTKKYGDFYLYNGKVNKIDEDVSSMSNIYNEYNK